MKSNLILKSHTTYQLSRIFTLLQGLFSSWKEQISTMDSRIKSFILVNKSESESTPWLLTNPFTCTVNPFQSTDTVKFPDFKRPLLCWNKTSTLFGFSNILIQITDWKWPDNPSLLMTLYWLNTKWPINGSLLKLKPMKTHSVNSLKSLFIISWFITNLKTSFNKREVLQPSMSQVAHKKMKIYGWYWEHQIHHNSSINHKLKTALLTKTLWTRR